MPFVITPDSPVQRQMHNRNLHERWALREEDLRQPGCHRTQARTLREAVYECAEAVGADCMLVSYDGRPVAWTWRYPGRLGVQRVGASLYRLGECLGSRRFDETLQPEDVVVMSGLEC